MKRILYVFALVAILVAGCKPELEVSTLNVTPTEINVGSAAFTCMLNVTASGEWTLSMEGDSRWCTPELTYGKGNASFKVDIKANNVAQERTAKLLFNSPNCQKVAVTINQAAGEGSEEEEHGDSYPDKASGITLSPAYPNADDSCTIRFKAQSGSELYGYAGDIYIHLGVVVEGEWSFVPYGWNENNDRCKMKKNAQGVYELSLKPSIREFFKTGETPVTKIAMVVRSSDGSKQTRPDQFCSVKDDKYKEDVFNPHPIIRLPVPDGARYGINYNSDNSVTFVLYDKDLKGKSHKYCYIVGDWNNWERIGDGAMHWDDSKGCWWITLDGFDADKEYRFQYRLGNAYGADTYVSDPYTEIVYDEWNDKYITGVPAFPAGARQLVSAFQINRPSYNWKHKDFKVEDRRDLVIYEMLFRDFSSLQNIDGAMARLDYIEKLGVNAVELMPVQEFDGNLSWGYNPNHWFALDKYYGTREDYKEFVDECHRRGLAVIVDVVYNHATGSHPWTKMWYNGNVTAENNPWFNVSPTHPYNVYHDMNHENPMVREHVKRSLEYLLTEYDVDGFRFDLTKGFTQKKTDPDVAAWGRYDQSRVDILKGYADHIWSVNDNAVVIFEHLSDWDEEKVLAEHGILLWRNVNKEYRTAVGGGSGNFSNMYSNAPFGGFVGYMESHDEERLCYSAGGLQGDALTAALGRAGAGAAFFLTVPGPKMIWQFGEIGYDYSIDYNGRTGEKPVVTDDYLAHPARKGLYDIYSKLLKFRRENPRFFDEDASFKWSPATSLKTIECSVDGRTFLVVGNFGKSAVNYTVPSGTWSDYMSGKTISGSISLGQGEFYLLTDF